MNSIKLSAEPSFAGESLLDLDLEYLVTPVAFLLFNPSTSTSNRVSLELSVSKCLSCLLQDLLHVSKMRCLLLASLTKRLLSISTLVRLLYHP